MDLAQLPLFVYYHAVNLPNYFLNGLVLGMQKLEEKKVAAELEKKRAVLEKTTQDMVTTAKFVPFL
jgi:hypothetical protein